MNILKGEKEKVALFYLNEAVLSAQKASCTRSFCGSIIVKNAKIIGRGYNSPPKNLESQRR
jgi:deoxycytidylate deaminase